MRTNIVLDRDLVEEATALTGIATKRELVRQALIALITARKRRSLLELDGKVAFHEGYDYKAMRSFK